MPPNKDFYFFALADEAREACMIRSAIASFLSGRFLVLAYFLLAALALELDEPLLDTILVVGSSFHIVTWIWEEAGGSMLLVNFFILLLIKEGDSSI